MTRDTTTLVMQATLSNKLRTHDVVVEQLRFQPVGRYEEWVPTLS